MIDTREESHEKRYDGMGRPQVGNTINVDLKKI